MSAAAGAPAPEEGTQMSATTSVDDAQDALRQTGPDRTKRGRRREAQSGRRHGVPGWWAIPGVAVVLALIYVPTALGSFYAFTDWKGIGGWNWVGLANFKAIFNDKELLGSLKNTVFLAFGFLVLTNVIGLLLALALNRNLKTRYLLRTLVFMPVVLAPIAVSYVWSF